MEEYIPIQLCRDRHLYRIHSRNLKFGVYVSVSCGFIGLRTKFGSVYLFQEYHYDTGPPFGTVKPIEVFENLPDDIKNKESLGTFCDSCRKQAAYIDFPEGEREKILSSGNKMMVPGEWKHLEDSACLEVMPVCSENRLLFDWLTKAEHKYGGSH